MRTGPSPPRLILCTAALAFATLAPIDAQQPTTGAGLTLPFTTAGTTSRGTADVSGTFRITQFVVQNNTLAAVGTVVAHVADPAAPRNLVTQLVLPVVTITATGPSGTTQQTFAQTTTGATASTTGSAAPPAFAPPSMPASPAPTASATLSGAASQVTTTAASSAQAGCGPVHLELGPLDMRGNGLAIRLDRLVVDVASSPGFTAANTQAALPAAAPTAPNAAVATTGQVSASTLNSGLCSVAGLVGQSQGANLQNLADLLNQVLTALG